MGSDPLSGVDATADKDGRYKVALFLSGSYRIEVSGPAGETYLPMSRGVGWPKAAARQEANLSLTRGVLVKGKVIETPANKPVAGAKVDLWAPGVKMPEGVRFPDALTTGADGGFQVLLPPGGWNLMINSDAGVFIRSKVAAAKLAGDQPIRLSTPNGGVATIEANDKKQFLYPDGWVSLDLKSGADTQEVTVKFEKATLQGQLLGPDDKAAAKAVMFYRQPMPVYPTAEKADPNTRRFAVNFFGRVPRADEPALTPVAVRDGKFELPLRDREAKYQLYFLDAKNELAASAEVSGKDQPSAVKLVACGTAKARFLDSQGKARANYQPRVQLLVPPGPHPNGQNPGAWNVDPKVRKVGARVQIAAKPRLWDVSAETPPNHDRILLSQADPLHYGKGFATNAQGEISFPALIPGATYRISLPDGKVKDFKVESGKTVDLKDITVVDSPKRVQPAPGFFRQPIQLKIEKVIPKEAKKADDPKPKK
jgi:hypothetical protein